MWPSSIMRMLAHHLTNSPVFFNTAADCYRVADWFGQLNNKMGGDLKKIQTVGAYFGRQWAWRALATK